MSVGRNDLCPCGSGKKYKKCCLLKAGNGDVAESPKSMDQEFMFQALNRMRRFTLDRKPHIKGYYKIRKLHSDIVGAMIQYHSDGKFEQRVENTPAPSDQQSPVLYLVNSEFDLDTRVGAQAFYDMMIYKPGPGLNCITEAFIQKHRYRKAEKIEFLDSMLDSRLGLFEITGIDFDEGYAHLKEVFTGDEYRIIDIGLSGDRNCDEFYLYTRIITYRDICFGTGLNLIFTKTDTFIKEHIRNHLNPYTPNGEFVRFSQLYNQYSKCPDKIKVVANTLK